MNRQSVFSTLGLSRRTALGRGAAVAAAIGLGSRGGRVAAQDATPTAMASHPFVGTWIVERPADPAGMPTTNIITADGGLIDPSIGAAGVWTATGERTADFTLIALVAEGGGSYFLVRGSITSMPEATPRPPRSPRRTWRPTGPSWISGRRARPPTSA